MSIVPVLTGYLTVKYGENPDTTNFSAYVENVRMMNLMLMGILMFGLIAAYVYSKEFEEDTLKATLAIPVGRTRLLIDKFIVVFAWVLSLLMVNVVEVIVIALVCQIPGLDVTAAMGVFAMAVRDSLFFMPLLTPIMFVTLVVKRYVAGIVFSIAAVVVNIVAIMSDIYYAYYPYTIPLFLLDPVSEDVIISLPISISILALTGVLGAVGSVIYFRKVSI
jgi:bacitracin transport system permease protein